jgi:hypothetical protein
MEKGKTETSRVIAVSIKRVYCFKCFTTSSTDLISKKVTFNHKTKTSFIFKTENLPQIIIHSSSE